MEPHSSPRIAKHRRRELKVCPQIVTSQGTGKSGAMARGEMGNCSECEFKRS